MMSIILLNKRNPASGAWVSACGGEVVQRRLAHGVGELGVVHGAGQDQRADQRGNRAPFDIEQGSHQDAGPLRGGLRPDPIEVCGKDVTVALEVFRASGDVLETMNPVYRGDAVSVGLLGEGRDRSGRH